MKLINKFLLLILLLMSFNAVKAEVRVSYLGPEGTYTEEAAKLWFHNGETLIPRQTVNEAVADVLAGSSDFAVIPQENTLGGAVVDYLDALIRSENTYVTGEIILPISQTLMGVPGTELEDIRTVCSHVQGLKQSARWREEHLPDAEVKEMPSTAAAAKFTAEQQDRSIAAIAAPGAAALYGLEVLAENVQITDANKTRFYVLSGDDRADETLTRAVFIAECGGRELVPVLRAVSEAGLRLVTLHDRPEGSRLGSYYYVIEVEDETGISDAQLMALDGIDALRLAGRFDSIGKDPVPALPAPQDAEAQDPEEEDEPENECIMIYDPEGTLLGECCPDEAGRCMLAYSLRDEK